MRIYLDYAATTPLKKEVFEAMKPYLLGEWGNASSVHQFGAKARSAIDEAREKIAHFLNCNPLELIFTSGGTEANNLAIKGTVFSNRVISNQVLKQQKSKLPHIIISAIEHHSVLDTCQWLEKMKFAEISYIPVDKSGIVSAEDVRKGIRKNTILVSLMSANNEIGTIQPIREIGKMIEKINRLQGTGYREQGKSHSRFNLSPATYNLKPILFHTDAVQAPEYLNCDVKYLHVDMLTLSAHKFGGPKGVGVLFVKKGLKLEPQNIGGAQEWGVRAGTENVAGIVGCGAAIENLKMKNEKRQLKIQNLRDKLIDGVLEKISGSILNGDQQNRLPNNANFCFQGIKSEALLVKLDLEGIAASSGSACVSQSLEPSHVISALGIPEDKARGCIRFSLGEQTTQREIDYVLKVLSQAVAEIRKTLSLH